MTFICHKYHIQPIHAKPFPKLVQILPIFCPFYAPYFSHILPINCQFYMLVIFFPYFDQNRTNLWTIFCQTMFMVKIGPIYGPDFVQILVQSCPYFDHIKKPRNRRAFLLFCFYLLANFLSCLYTSYNISKLSILSTIFFNKSICLSLIYISTSRSL